MDLPLLKVGRIKSSVPVRVREPGSPNEDARFASHHSFRFVSTHVALDPPRPYPLGLLDNRTAASKNHTLVGEQKANILLVYPGATVNSAASILRTQIEASLANRI